MAGEGGAEIPLVVTHDAPIEVVLEKAADPGKTTPVVTEQEGVQDLKAQVEQAKRESVLRRSQADRQIQEAVDRANAAERQVVTTQKDAVGTVIESLSKDKETARRDYQAAMEAGDYAKAADANDRMSMANARIVEAEKGKLALEEAIKAPPARQAQVHSDPVEAFTARMSPASAAWIRAHPEYVTDAAKNDAMIESHNWALRQNHQADTAGYFAAIEKRLGLTEPLQHTPQTEVVNTENLGRAPAPASAPANRDIGHSPRRGPPPSVKLTAEEVKAARAMNLDPKKTDQEVLRAYAENLVALVAEGKISRQF